MPVGLEKDQISHDDGPKDFYHGISNVLYSAPVQTVVSVAKSAFDNLAKPVANFAIGTVVPNVAVFMASALVTNSLTRELFVGAIVPYSIPLVIAGSLIWTILTSEAANSVIDKIRFEIGLGEPKTGQGGRPSCFDDYLKAGLLLSTATVFAAATTGFGLLGGYAYGCGDLTSRVGRLFVISMVATGGVLLVKAWNTAKEMIS